MGQLAADTFSAGEYVDAFCDNYNRKQSKMSITDNAPCENILNAGPELARFLIGSDEPDEIIRQANINCRSLAQPLAQVLLPNLHPMMSH